jgi:hypothetical protein
LAKSKKLGLRKITEREVRARKLEQLVLSARKAGKRRTPNSDKSRAGVQRPMSK